LRFLGSYLIFIFLNLLIQPCIMVMLLVS